MKKKFQSPVGLNPGGVGPKIIRRTLPAVLSAILIGLVFPKYVEIPLITTSLRQVVGIFLLATGMGTYAISIYQFLKVFPKGMLVTSGLYAISRNPVYASWIILLLPSIALLSNNWIFFMAAINMYVAFVILIGKEEESLLNAFGQQFVAYKSQVKRLFLF